MMIDLNKISIFDVANRLGIKKSNKNDNYHCPAHKDVNASLSINEDVFNCFSCGVSGKNIALVQLSKNCSKDEAITWLNDEYGEKKEKKEKLQIRRIGENISKNSRFYYEYPERLKLRLPTEEDIINIRLMLNKRFSFYGFKRAGSLISEKPYGITFEKKEFWHNTKGEKGIIVLEGATDYLTALSDVELVSNYKIFSQRTKTTKFKLPKFKLNYYIILDPDNTPDNFLSNIKMSEKEIRELNLYFLDLSSFNVKDISDFYANGGETKHLESLFNSTERFLVDEYYKSNPEIPFCFWNRNGEINVYELWSVLRKKGFFYGYIDDNEDNRNLYRLEGNVLFVSDNEHLQNYVYNEMLDSLPEKLNDKITVRDVKENIMRSSGQLYDTKKFNTLPFQQLTLNKDNKDSAYYYFKNAVVEVKADSISLLDYSELQGCVLKRHIRDHEIKIVETVNFDDFSFYQFLRNVCRQQVGANVDENRFNALKSTIGYLLHKYISPVVQKAVIFSESNLTEKSKGRTGKGLISEAIGKLVKISSNDGKNLQQNSQFAFQTYNIGDNVILFNDVQKHFDFERLFSIITDGFEFEKKGSARTRIKPSDSPKILINTNFPIKSENSSSFKARMREMELYCYYNAEFTPAIEFEEWFFVDWSKSEWDLFYCMMFTFVQFYLNNGLTEYESETVEMRKLLHSGGMELLEFMESFDFENEYSANEIYYKFIEYAGHSEKEFSKKKFTTALFLYCEQFKINIEKIQRRQEGKVQRFYKFKKM